jgi:hypothetical protein
VRDGTLTYTDLQGITTDVRPAAVKESTLDNLIDAKKFCQPLEFFGRYLVAHFEEKAAALEKQARAQIELRRQVAQKRELAARKQNVASLIKEIKGR